ncbi:MAG: LbtU family siderophore porin [Magnetococcus sp. DMHC-6]
MKQTVIKNLLPILALGISGTALAEETAPPPSPTQMWDLIQKQQKEINELKSHLESTQKQLQETNQVVNRPVEKTTTVSSEAGATNRWSDKISIGGAIEVEASHVSDVNDVNTSDVTLATAEINLDAKISEWSAAQIVLLYEEGETDPINVDSATITLGNLEKLPLYLTAGLMTLPFGGYPTQLISDPLTLEMGETSDTAIQVGVDSNGITGSVFAYNGQSQLTGDGDTIDHFGMNVGYTYENPKFNVELGLSYTNALENSDGISGADLDGNGVADVNIGSMANHIGAVAGHAIFKMAGISVMGEYLTATERFATGELAWNGSGAEPSAWNGEIGYTLDIKGYETTLSAAYQGTKEAVNIGLPERRLLGGVSVGIFENTKLAVELTKSKDYEVRDGGSGGDENTATMQLAVGF